MMRFPILFAVTLSLGLSLAAVAAEPQGKLLSAEGPVELSRDAGGSWSPAAAEQSLYERDLVKTGRGARAALLLSDGTQLRLNAYSTLEIRKVQAGVRPAAAGAGGTDLALTSGELWLRSKTPRRDLSVETPAATAAIRGTEVDLKTDGESAELVVVEGLVAFANDLGSVSVGEGEGGRARRGEPPVKFAIVNPENAVQWVLYYPSFARGPAAPSLDVVAAAERRLAADPADGAARLTVVAQALAAKQWERVLTLTEPPLPVSARDDLWAARLEALLALGRDPEPFLASEAASIAASARLEREVAVYRLGYGDAPSAVEHLQHALALASDDQDALATLALVELTRNRVDEAEQLVERSLTVNAEHSLTRLAAARAAQARFELEDALEHAEAARRLDPEAVEPAALVGELLFGFGRTAEAAKVAAELVERHPDSARAQALDGFIAFGLGDLDHAASSFGHALAADPTRADVHLGLGLLAFRRRETDRGLMELLAATTLEPKVSLYHSYLGKAFAEVGLRQEALTSLATAKRLDPRDPTPHLYAGLLLRDLNRHGEAAQELSEAIAKNDYRAVYRSRFLLDRDQATRNVSLAQVYDEIGFAAYGAYHAVRSIDLDFANSAAHLFAAGTLISLPDRTGAAGSELLLARLLMPVNQSSFNTFNEYTSLFDLPDVDSRVRAEGGEHAYRYGAVSSFGGNDRVAFGALASYTAITDPLGPNSDSDLAVGNLLGKIALGAHQSLLVDLRHGSGDEGNPSPPVLLTDPNGVFPIRLLTSDNPDLNRRSESTLDEVLVGYHAELAPTHHLLVVGSRGHVDYEARDPNGYEPAFPGCGWCQESTSDEYAVEALEHLTLGRHQLSWGLSWRQSDDELDSLDFCSDGYENMSRLEGVNRFRAAHVRYTLSTPSSSTVTLGLRWDEVELEDLYLDYRSSEDEVSPQLGLRWQLTPHSSLRLAAFRNFSGATSASRLEASMLAGFPFGRVEPEATRRDEADVAWDLALGPAAFLSVSAYTRDVNEPHFLLASGETWVRTRLGYDVDGARLDLDLRLAPMLTIYQEVQARWIDVPPYDQKDLEWGVGLRLIHPSGWFVGLTETYLRQRFDETSPDVNLPETGVWLTDLSVRKELPNKRGSIGVWGRNLFEEKFNVVIEGLTVVERIPAREAAAFVELNF